MPSPIVEIRVPTYDRAPLLRRALGALRAQTHHDWRAVVLDDGSAARAVVEEIGDERIVYRPNPTRLGADRNIMQAFAPAPMAGGGFFYVLEDDNFIAPTFLADNLGWAAAHDVAVVVNNQWLEVPGDDPAAPPRHAGQQANASHVSGSWTADDFRLALLWGLPLSNGSVFWQRGCRTDFGLDSGHDPALHEWLRAWRLADPVYFNATPNAFWHPSVPDGPRPRHVGMAAFLRRERALMAMRRSLLADLARRGETAKLLSDRYRTPLVQREEAVVKAGGRWPGPPLLPPRRRASLAAKALALRLLVPPVAF